MNLRNDCNIIIEKAIQSVLPDEAVKRALQGRTLHEGRLILVSVGKAAWTMANAAHHFLERTPDNGIVITKYGHSKGKIGNLEIYEAGHPVPDENSYKATKRALELTQGLTEKDEVIFLLSGGGSALFECPLIPETELEDITRQLLACGANIVEVNTIRKRLSAVKGGRFAKHLAPAQIFTVVLSDVIGDPLDMIASGPAYPDSTTCLEANNIAKKYNLKISDTAWQQLQKETPKELANVETVITGNVKQLCDAAENVCRQLGYETVRMTETLNCEAMEAGKALAVLAKLRKNTEQSLAFILGGETVVRLTGTGKGGRNQELALAAAEGIAGLKNVALFSVGSDGTDGPTEAAGGYVDGMTYDLLGKNGLDVSKMLKNNDSYHALEAVEGLIITGPTGTNVNDLTILLIRTE